jgi:hypothetical protein
MISESLRYLDTHRRSRETRSVISKDGGTGTATSDIAMQTGRDRALERASAAPHHRQAAHQEGQGSRRG